MATPAQSLPCPVCRSPVPLAPEHQPRQFPFCSERCRLRDLGAWFKGSYVVEGRTVDELQTLDGTDREEP